MADDERDKFAAFRLTAHARDVMAARQIDLRWIAETVADPEHTEPDPGDADAIRLFRRIKARRGRWLRVVIRRETVPPLIVTAFFDRGRRGN